MTGTPTNISPLTESQPCKSCGQPTLSAWYGEPLCAGCKYEETGDFDYLLDCGDAVEIKRYIERLRSDRDSKRRIINQLRTLLRDIDQSAPAVLKVSKLGLDFATALQAVRDEMDG